MRQVPSGAHAQRCADEDERLRRLAVLLRARRVAQHARECAHCCGVVKLRVGEIRLSRRFVRRLAVVTTSRGGSSCGAHPGLRDRIQCPEHAERAKQVRARLRLPLRSQQREQCRQQLGILCIRSRRVAGGAHELRKYRQRRATSRVRGLIPQRINDRREEERRQLAHRFPPDEDETAERRQHTRGDRGGRVGEARAESLEYRGGVRLDQLLRALDEGSEQHRALLTLLRARRVFQLREQLHEHRTH